MPTPPRQERAGQGRRALALVLAAGVTTAIVAGAQRWAGPDSRRLGVVAAWAPMAALGTATRWGPLRLPDGWHRLRGFERTGRVYELLGVKVAKAALRRGPLAIFNPKLHLPSEPTPERLAALERRMCEAEAAHVILLAGTSVAAARAARRGHRRTARWMAGTNVVVNLYPVLLQRYNRAVLRQRFDVVPPADADLRC